MLGYSGEIERHFMISGLVTPRADRVSGETNGSNGQDEPDGSIGNVGKLARNDEMAGIGGAEPNDRYVNPAADRSVQDSDWPERAASSDVENAPIVRGAEIETSRALNSLAPGGVL